MMTAFHEQYSDIESAFVRSFSYQSTSTQTKCHCGRVYFTTAQSGGDFDEGELERLIESEKKEPDKFISSGEFDSISIVNIEGKELVPQCACGGLERYMEFLERYLDEVAKFAAERLKQKKRDALREAERCGSLLGSITG